MSPYDLDSWSKGSASVRRILRFSSLSSIRESFTVLLPNKIRVFEVFPFDRDEGVRFFIVLGGSV